MEQGFIILLAILLSFSGPSWFMIGFYLGRRSKYEDANKLEPTPIITAPTLKVEPEDEPAPREHLQSLMVD